MQMLRYIEEGSIRFFWVTGTNPAVSLPELGRVRSLLAQERLFLVVQDAFLTETARLADVVLPATMFMEHDDLYQGGGHQHILLGPKLIEPPGECRSNHEVVCALARRLGAEHAGFRMSPRELIDRTLSDSGHGTLARLEAEKWLDVQPPFRAAHFLDGFGHADGRFRFKPDWATVRDAELGPMGPWKGLPALPDHCTVIEEATEEFPFRLATSPARQFLNSSFNETPTSIAKEGRPEAMIHPDDAAEHGVGEGDWVRLKNERGEVLIRARLFAGVRRGVLIAEGIWPNSAFPDGRGINTLTGADPVAPFGGAAVHDTRVWIRPAT